jgi:hypothetical protein
MEKDHLSTMKVLEKLEETIMPLIQKEKFDFTAAMQLYNSIIVTLARDYIDSREDINLPNEPMLIKAFISNIVINFTLTIAKIYPDINPKIHPDCEEDE